MYLTSTAHDHLDTGHHLDVHVDGHPTCPCGQELDLCARAHCPRCGHRLHGQPHLQLV